MSDNISAPAAVDNPLNAKELILSYIARLLNNENPAEPKNVSRADEVNIYIAKLIAAGSGGGDTPEIPAPTAEDNGRFLGVDSGAYALLSAPGGSVDVFPVTLTHSTWPAEGYSSDKTFAEIDAAYKAGKLVLLHAVNCSLGGGVNGNSQFAIMREQGGMLGVEGYFASFSDEDPNTFDIRSGVVTYKAVAVNTSNVWSISTIGTVTLTAPESP